MFYCWWLEWVWWCRAEPWAFTITGQLLTHKVWERVCFPGKFIVTKKPMTLKSLSHFAGASSTLAIVSLMYYIVSFSLGWGPIPMLVMSEITPVKARGPASAISVVVAWTSSFIVTKVTTLSVLNKPVVRVFG